MTSFQKQGLMQVERNKQEMDNLLDVLSEGLTSLKDIARIQGEELDLQKAMIADIQKNVDDADDRLNNLNTDLSEVLNDKGRCCQNQYEYYVSRTVDWSCRCYLQYGDKMKKST